MIAKILVVDDDLAIRTILRAHLSRAGHHVLEAADGAQAFAVAEKEMPHLIVMDVVMPGLYGTTALEKLWGYWRTAEIPIIVISGLTDADILDRFPQSPKIRFLKKPVDFKLLDKAIFELLPLGGYTP